MKDITKSTPAIECVLKGGDPNKTVVWACGKCHNAARSEEDAKLCCAPFCCDTCGKEIKSYCEDCSRKKQHERDKAVYDKATKIKYADYKGQMIQCDHCDEYFWDLDSFLDSHDDLHADDMPTWVWGTYEIPLSFNAEDVISDKLERDEFYEDAFDHISKESIKEMQSFFDAWRLKYPLNSYMVDNAVVVDIEEEVHAVLAERYKDESTDPGNSDPKGPGDGTSLP